MKHPWCTLDQVQTEEGPLRLAQRGESEFLITIDGRVLMAGATHRSEALLATAAAERLKGKSAPKVLVGGLGMGLTLRTALDHLPQRTQVTVVELNPVVVEWCRGPLKALTEGAVEDPRVTVRIADVAQVIQETASAEQTFDAILLDLYEGPHETLGAAGAPFYGRQALKTTRAALAPGGVFAVWSEQADAPFEQRLKTQGFTVERLAPERGGSRHVVYLATVSSVEKRVRD